MNDVLKQYLAFAIGAAARVVGAPPALYAAVGREVIAASSSWVEGFARDARPCLPGDLHEPASTTSVHRYVLPVVDIASGPRAPLSGDRAGIFRLATGSDLGIGLRGSPVEQVKPLLSSASEGLVASTSGQEVVVSLPAGPRLTLRTLCQGQAALVEGVLNRVSLVHASADDSSNVSAEEADAGLGDAYEDWQRYAVDAMFVQNAIRFHQEGHPGFLHSDGMLQLREKWVPSLDALEHFSLWRAQARARCIVSVRPDLQADVQSLLAIQTVRWKAQRTRSIHLAADAPSLAFLDSIESINESDVAACPARVGCTEQGRVVALPTGTADLERIVTVEYGPGIVLRLSTRDAYAAGVALVALGTVSSFSID